MYKKTIINPSTRFLGHKHTADTKKKIGDNMAARWKDPDSFHNQEAYRQLLSDRFSKQNAASKNLHSRCRHGCRSDLKNMYFRSAWEANYARYLNFLKEHGEIFKWEYEADTFWFVAIKRGVRSYTPDFKIWEKETSEPYYEELKGWMDAKSKTKLSRMAKYFPHIKVVLVDEKKYRAIAKSIQAMIPNWE